MTMSRSICFSCFDAARFGADAVTDLNDPLIRDLMQRFPWEWFVRIREHHAWDNRPAPNLSGEARLALSYHLEERQQRSSASSH